MDWGLHLLALTGRQFDEARHSKDFDPRTPPVPAGWKEEFWLYVVDRLNAALKGGRARVRPIRNPAAEVERFHFQATDWWLDNPKVGQESGADVTPQGPAFEPLNTAELKNLDLDDIPDPEDEA